MNVQLDTAYTEGASKSVDVKTQRMLEWIRDYANTHVNSTLMDVRRTISPPVVLDFGNKGFFGLQVPEEYSGLALSNEVCVTLLEQVGAVDLGLGTLVVLQNFLGVRPILNYATEETREDLLPRLATGRELGAFGLTEPVAGSNPTALTGTATVLRNGKIRLNSTKMWIGNASWAGAINVFLKLVDERGRSRGVTGYIVRKGTKGLEMGPELMTMGMRGMVQNRFSLVDADVTQDMMLGSVGQGMEIANDAMMYTRLALGAIFLGSMKRCLQLMTRYAERRESISTGRLIENSLTMMRVGSMTAKTKVLENLLTLTARWLDQGVAVPEEFLIVGKVSGSEFLWEAADLTLQMMGGRGYLENNVIPQILRDARVGRIFEGPTETMQHYMGARLLRYSDRLLQFLRLELDASDVAKTLEEARDNAQEQCMQLVAPYKGRQRTDLACLLLGETVSWGILFAVSKSRQVHDNSAEASRVVQWASDQFYRSVESLTKISNLIDVKHALSVEESQRVVNGYKVSIGDIEQTLPGEDLALDPYLSVEELTSYV